ncbi:hypothetical protein DL317_00030 [Limosilactobacillus reuteri]|nr:hypothetical protein DL317_00030 [Limosilactobacillus reuteri]
MSGRKTDFEERLTIIEELIKHDVNYNWAVEKYHISYNKFMAGIKSIAKAVMTQNHFVIAEAKLSQKRSGRKLTDSRQRIAY